MHVAWTYSGHSVSLLKFVDEANRRRNLTTDVYRTAPKQDPETDCSLTTGDLSSIPRLSWTDQVWTRWLWKRFLAETFDPAADVLLTENALGPASVAVAERHDTPTVFFVRSLVILGLDIYDQRKNPVSNFRRADFGGKVQFPFLYAAVEQYADAMAAADVVVANSEFVADRLEEQFGVEPELIYPPIEIDEYRVEYDPDGKITMVNPRTKYKGADIFLDVAAALPDEEFLVAGFTNDPSIERQIEELDNVEHVGWQDDMRAVYGRSKLLVVPSRIDEAFGRVAAEAMASGIPCVVSERGGLPEVVGDTGRTICEIERTERWIKAIQSVLDEDDSARRSERRERIQRFSMDSQIQHLFDVLEEVTKETTP